MKLTDLFEKYNYESINLTKLVSITEKHCYNALESYINTNRVIYRGTSKVKDVGIYDPSVELRGSANTSNHYTSLLDTNYLNKDFPKRSRSFICTTNLRTAKDYGNVSVILPFDSVKIAAVNKADMWHTNIKLPIANLNRKIEELNNRLDLMYEEIGLDEDADMDTVINAIIQNPAGLKFFHLENASEADAKTFTEELREAYSYKAMGCTLVDANKLPEASELWFSGKCIIMPASTWDALKQEVLDEYNEIE